MDFLLSSYADPIGSNLFQKSYDLSFPGPPPVDGRFRILPDGTYRTTFITTTSEAFRVVDVTI